MTCNVNGAEAQRIRRCPPGVRLHPRRCHTNNRTQNATFNLPRGDVNVASNVQFGLLGSVASCTRPHPGPMQRPRLCYSLTPYCS